MAQYSSRCGPSALAPPTEVQRAVGGPAGRIVARGRQVRAQAFAAQTHDLALVRVLREALGRLEPEVAALDASLTGPFASCPPYSQTWSPTIAAVASACGAQERRLGHPFLQAPCVVEPALPRRRDRAVGALAADEQHPVRRGDAGRPGARPREGQRLGRGLPLGERHRSAGSGVSVKTVVVGSPSASRPPST